MSIHKVVTKTQTKHFISYAKSCYADFHVLKHWLDSYNNLAATLKDCTEDEIFTAWFNQQSGKLPDFRKPIGETLEHFVDRIKLFDPPAFEFCVAWEEESFPTRHPKYGWYWTKSNTHDSGRALIILHEPAHPWDSELIRG